MPTSVMKFVTVKAPGMEYRLICFRFGGNEEFYAGKGFGTFNYVAGVLIGPNSALLVDRVGGHGRYALEKAGFLDSADLAKAWEYILRNFDGLPERCVMSVERSAVDWEVWEVKEV